MADSSNNSSRRISSDVDTKVQHYNIDSYNTNRWPHSDKHYSLQEGINGKNDYCNYNDNSFLKLSKFIISTVLLLIANALLIRCITSPQSLDFIISNYNHPHIYQLMSLQRIRQIRYNQHNENSDNAKRTIISGLINTSSIWSEYVKGGEKSTRLREHIKNILVPRVPGSQGNIDVRNYIIKELNGLGYSVQVDLFRDRTPIGEVVFGNIIADSNPKACKQLVLSCHYDSKKMINFLGATDSAVPCAILLEIAHTLKKNNFVNPEDNKSVDSVRFIFFDGEEAFDQWTDTDSLYGSRHLAQKWSQQAMPKECGDGTELKRISLFVLLDLIGSKDTEIPRYFDAKSYSKLMALERQYLTEFSESRKDLVFSGNYNIRNLGVQDDHIPFYTRNVPTLLLLSSPFPSVWHTIYDNHDCIDYNKTVRTLAVLDRFTLDYLKGN